MDTLNRVRRATARRSRVEQEWREAIREAHAQGESLRAIGDAAGITHPRVLQIVREPR